jgi:Zn-dependent alcohol dehydrogenase
VACFAPKFRIRQDWAILTKDELITGRYPPERINEAIAEVKRGEALRNVIIF